MHESLLASAALPQPSVVFGMLLRPYSLGHELFLHRENNPIILGDGLAFLKTSRVDLVQAVFICSQTFEECRKSSLAFRPWSDFKLWIWRMRTRKLNTATEILKFMNYREWGSLSFPLVETAESSNRSSTHEPGSPFLIRLHQFLTLKKGLSDAEAWDYPYGFAMQQFIAYWESEGGLNVYNRHDEAHDKFVAEMEAEDKAKAAATKN